MGIINKEIKQYDLVIHNLLDQTKSRTKKKLRNFDRLFLSVLIFIFFIYRGKLHHCYYYHYYYHYHYYYYYKNVGGAFRFCNYAKTFSGVSNKSKKKKTQKETKNQKEILRRKFECHLSDFKLSDLLSDMSIIYFCWWWDYRYFTITGKCVCVCVYSNSRNDVPRVAQRYGTIAAHTRRRASVLVVFVVFCVHMYSLAG